MLYPKKTKKKKTKKNKKKTEQKKILSSNFNALINLLQNYLKHHLFDS